LAWWKISKVITTGPRLYSTCANNRVCSF
jgi:hypothetical protein